MPYTKDLKTRITIRLPEKIKKQLQDEKVDTGNSINSIINRSIREFIFNRI